MFFFFCLLHQCLRPSCISTECARRGSHGRRIHLHRFRFEIAVRLQVSVKIADLNDCLSTVRLPLWLWLSMVRVRFTLSPVEAVVAVQDLFASSVAWESDVCAKSPELKQKYAPIASSITWPKRRTSDRRASVRGRPMHADPPSRSHSELLVLDMPMILSPRQHSASRGQLRVCVAFVCERLTHPFQPAINYVGSETAVPLASSSGICLPAFRLVTAKPCTYSATLSITTAP
jgi:hypothetical protein